MGADVVLCSNWQFQCLLLYHGLAEPGGVFMFSLLWIFRSQPAHDEVASVGDTGDTVTQPVLCVDDISNWHCMDGDRAPLWLSRFLGPVFPILYVPS